MELPSIENIFRLYLWIGAGVLIGVLFKKYRDTAVRIGTRLIIDILTPVLIFLTMTSSSFMPEFFTVFEIIVFKVGAVLFHWTTTYFILGKRIEDKKKLGAYFFLNGMPNLIIYGVPIALALFGDSMVVILVILGSTSLILRGTLGNYIGEKFGGRFSTSPREAVIKFITFPPLLGIIAGFIGLPFRNMLPLDLFVTVKSALNPPFGAIGGIIIGIILSKLNRKDVSDNIGSILTVSLWRFGFSFIYVLSVIFLLVFPENSTPTKTLMLIGEMGPPAVINVAYSAYFGLDEKFAAMSVATITLMALILLPPVIIFGLTFL